MAVYGIVKEVVPSQIAGLALFVKVGVAGSVSIFAGLSVPVEPIQLTLVSEKLL